MSAADTSLNAASGPDDNTPLSTSRSHPGGCFRSVPGIVIICLLHETAVVADESDIVAEFNINYLELRYNRDTNPVYLDADASVGDGAHSVIVTFSVRPLGREFEAVETQLL